MGISTAAAIVGGSVVSGVLGSQSSKDAAQAQAGAAGRAADATLEATRESIAATERMADMARADMAPWRAAGMGALARMMGQDPDIFADNQLMSIASGGAPSQAPQYQRHTGAGGAVWYTPYSPTGEMVAGQVFDELPAGGVAVDASGTPLTSAPSGYPNPPPGWSVDDVLEGIERAKTEEPQERFRITRILEDELARFGYDTDGTPLGASNVTTGGSGSTPNDLQRAMALPAIEPRGEFFEADPFLPSEEFAEPFSLSLSEFEADPGYQFRLQEGEKALERAASARGVNTSGRTLKDFIRFNQGMAADEYGRAYGRRYGDFVRRYGNELDVYNARLADRTSRYNRLAGMAGTGQAASSQLASQGLAAGGATASALLNQGNALANIYTQSGANQAGAIMSGGASINNAVQGGLQNYLAYQNQQQQNAFQNDLIRAMQPRTWGPAY